MFDNIYTRKDGYAFGLERSGFIVPTTVKVEDYYIVAIKLNIAWLFIEDFWMKNKIRF